MRMHYNTRKRRVSGQNMVFICSLFITILSVVQTIQCQMIEQVMKNELATRWVKAVMD